MTKKDMMMMTTTNLPNASSQLMMTISDPTLSQQSTTVLHSIIGKL
jgi:hypothetical protein